MLLIILFAVIAVAILLTSDRGTSLLHGIWKLLWRGAVWTIAVIVLLWSLTSLGEGELSFGIKKFLAVLVAGALGVGCYAIYHYILKRSTSSSVSE